ncbi:universal stress protein [Saccharopolyspora pogona]|uniref:universal stress protein n=1 Tax=Saccharopolyspora pogona TaxID=333966 RepID=UPI001CC2427A
MSKVVIVGIDGSADSVTALRWAVNYAVTVHAVVRMVHAWTPLPKHGLPKARRRKLEVDRARSASDAERVLSEALRCVDVGSVVIEQRVVEGAPGVVLVDSSRNADQLVVGATGGERDAFLDRPPLGSTARYVTRHASCPVTVIRHSHTRIEPLPAKRYQLGAVRVPRPRQRHQNAHAQLGWGPL